LAHIHSPKNPLWQLHRAHHKNNYTNSRPRWPRWHEFLFWFGSFPKTFDVLLTFTLPALLCAWLFGGSAWLLLPFHYFWEVFLSDTVLEHNPKIGNPFVRFLAVGQYHLHHHRTLNSNYGFFTPLWDIIFGTNAPSCKMRNRALSKTMRPPMS
jgi:sterol desaturase/sphingolipid hydroxylase (fatty acid hydroxylase superfamily)